MTDTLRELVPQLANRRVLVLGDVILDEYVTGRANRMSREAPVPVLELESREYIPGGAANPAANIVSLGSYAMQVGIIGADDAADNLQQQLEQRGIDYTGLVIDRNKPTTLKTRILAQMGLRFPQQVARIDTISRRPIGQFIEAALLQRLQNNLDNLDAVLISDYENGLLTPTMVDLSKQILSGRVPLIVDAQGGLNKYSNFDIVKCNADDAAAYLDARLVTDDDFVVAAQELAGQLALKKALIITRGSDGATLATADETVHLGAPAVSDVYDTVGAGDTWIAVLTLAYIAGAGLVDAAMLANFASGIVVRHVGNYTPSPDELLAAIVE